MFEVNDKIRVRVTITKYKNIFSKTYTENWSREIFIINSVLKTNPWASRFKRRRNNRKFLSNGIVVHYIINELLSRTRQSY